MTLTMTDLFCGAGGSSTGAVTAGITVAMAANHWAKAIETHTTNHPDTRHDCADVSQVDPRRYPTTDILWASPECTNHSQAKGIKRAVDSIPDMFGLTLPDEAAERSRATMWDVVRFAERQVPDQVGHRIDDGEVAADPCGFGDDVCVLSVLPSPVNAALIAATTRPEAYRTG